MNDNLENQLRAELRRRADGAASSGTLLAEQIIAAARTQPRPAGRRSWPTWTLPLLAAGAVAAIVAGVLVGVAQIRPDAAPAPGNSHLGTTAPTTSQPAPSPSVSVPAPVVPPPTTTHKLPSTTQSSPPAGLTGVDLLDLTFAAADHGFALASSDCVSGPGKCTALLRTTDGVTWKSMPGARFNVPGVNGCADPCVSHLRYATDDIGYAFGPSALYLTKDGGQNWTRQTGGATQVETLNGYVLRVRTDGTSCSVCGGLERSSIGGTSWTPIDLPGVTSGSVPLFDLGFAGQLAFVVANLYPTQSDLFVSSDGTTWTDRGNPCDQDTIHVSGAGDGSIAVECGSHEGGSASVPEYVTVSTDGGKSFGPARPITPSGGYADALAAVSSSTVLVGRDGIVRRTTDGGRSWQTVAPSGTVGFLGFESGQIGRAVTDGSTIWTTRDAGASWTPVHFG